MDCSIPCVFVCVEFLAIHLDTAKNERRSHDTSRGLGSRSRMAEKKRKFSLEQNRSSQSRCCGLVRFHSSRMTTVETRHDLQGGYRQLIGSYHRVNNLTC